MRKKLFMLAVMLAVLTMVAGCAKTEAPAKEEPLLGASCGTVSPDSRDECCARQNADTIHIQCVGSWKYNLDTAICEFVCETQPVEEEKKTETKVGLANPASTYCAQKGYDLEIRDEADGQVGYCIFPDGNECEEWSFFRKECGDKYQ